MKTLSKTEKAQSGGHTQQYCQQCHKPVEIDFLIFLLNLDDKIVCPDCQE